MTLAMNEVASVVGTPVLPNATFNGIPALESSFTRFCSHIGEPPGSIWKTRISLLSQETGPGTMNGLDWLLSTTTVLLVTTQFVIAPVTEAVSVMLVISAGGLAKPVTSVNVTL